MNKYLPDTINLLTAAPFLFDTLKGFFIMAVSNWLSEAWVQWQQFLLVQSHLCWLQHLSSPLNWNWIRLKQIGQHKQTQIHTSTQTKAESTPSSRCDVSKRRLCSKVHTFQSLRPRKPSDVSQETSSIKHTPPFLIHQIISLIKTLKRVSFRSFSVRRKMSWNKDQTCPSGARLGFKYAVNGFQACGLPSGGRLQYLGWP